MTTERALTFGPGGHLSGILAEPRDAALGKAKPAVLLTNVGVSHRVGPFRLNVEIARRIAALGFHSLRFDFSGLGDSEASRAGGTDESRAVAEAKAAMDLITKRTGIERFVMIGLCSGADKTHMVAKADPRIVGAVFIDGYAYTTAVFYLLRIFSKLSNFKRVKLAFLTRWRKLMARLGRAPKGPEPYRAVIASPDRRRVEQELVGLAARGVRQLHLFTVSTDYIYNYAGQFWHMYPGLKAHQDRVVTERYPEVDHTLSVVAMQRLFVDRICRWLGHF